MTTLSTVPTSGAVVYFAGSDWDSVAGTDRRLVTALGRVRRVLWVEPPVSMVARLRGNALAGDRVGLTDVAPGVTRLKVLAPPLSSRPGMRELTAALRSRAVARAVDELGLEVAVTVVASPRERFPERLGGARVLYITDDWVEGAAMMGLSRDRILGDLERNRSVASMVAVVSPDLAERFGGSTGVPVELLPNGCEAPPHPVSTASLPAVTRDRRAIVVGQLNERIDVPLLEAVVATGVPLTVIGPRTDRLPATGDQLDRLLAMDDVDYLGELPAGDLAPHLASAGVGLTPYIDNAFNRSSFPLKTLEYLANGLPVVSTDLPAVGWLATDLISVGRDHDQFVALVHDAVELGTDAAADARRRGFASGHSWDARAAQLLSRVAELQAHPAVTAP